MREKRIVIIGMGTAAAGAAAAINHTNPRAEVSIIEKRSYEMYSPCSLPFALEGRLGFESLKHDFPARGPKTKVYLNTEAVKIDTHRKEVVVKNQGGHRSLSYDSLIIATGARPVIPPIENITEFMGTHAYAPYSWEDVFLLDHTKGKIRKVTTIGAGAIGVEFAVALRMQGLEVRIVEIMGQVFPNTLDSDMARHVHEYLMAEGITVLTNSVVEKAEGTHRLEGIVIGIETYDTDLIILACGTLPNVEWLKTFGIACNENGIITNKRMMTNIPGIYAAGDCVETYHALTEKRCRSLLAVPGRNQGRVAGINATGGRAHYHGTMNTSVSVIGDHAVGSTGLTAEQARQEGYELIMQKARGHNKPVWYPGHREVIVKLIADKRGRLLGGQVFGEKLAVKNRIDIISAYLFAKGNLRDMVKGELAYCPDIASIPDPLTTAVDFMLRRI
jgi:NADH oxidase (H2O2-forming)